jgi:hypothetical protein
MFHRPNCGIKEAIPAITGSHVVLSARAFATRQNEFAASDFPRHVSPQYQDGAGGAAIILANVTVGRKRSSAPVG